MLRSTMGKEYWMASVNINRLVKKELQNNFNLPNLNKLELINLIRETIFQKKFLYLIKAIGIKQRNSKRVKAHQKKRNMSNWDTKNKFTH